MRTAAILLVAVVCLMLAGCTKKRADQVAKVTHDVKTGVRIADQALAAIDGLVGIAAPGSTAAKSLDKATVIAQKVDGKVQSITITVPVDDIASPAVVAPASTAPKTTVEPVPAH